LLAPQPGEIESPFGFVPLPGMKSKILTPLLFALTVVWGCGGQNNQQRYEEVMKTHDEVMPKMNDIYKLKGVLKKKIASSPEMAEDQKNAIETAIVRLDSASEGMMVWMRNFNPPSDSLGEEKTRVYLEDQKQKVQKVKDDILKAIESGQALE